MSMHHCEEPRSERTPSCHCESRCDRDEADSNINGGPMNSTNSMNSSNSANSQSHLAQVARTVTRPIIAIIFAGVIAQVVVERIAAPDWFVYGLAMPCILWWFGERTITHLRERKEDRPGT